VGAVIAPPVNALAALGMHLFPVHHPDLPVCVGRLSDTAAEGMLLAAATAIHLPEGEARATVASARRAVLGG
jgi:hypothetical protein